MAKVAYTVSHLPVWHPRGFGDQEIANNSSAALGIMQGRIARAVNVFDVPAKPLQKAYARQKIRAGKVPIRNWDFTGATVAAMGAFRLAPGLVGIGVDWRLDPRALRGALFNQLREPMVGLSPNDKQEVRVVIVQNRSERRSV